MKRFKHVNARTLQEAATIINKSAGKAKILAGGTDLLGQMKDDILPEYPEVIINIKNISGLDYISNDERTLKIGALTRLEDIAKNEIVKKRCTLLADAAQNTASPHIREMGTIGGNICQSNRCWYYWVPDNRFYCMRKGGRECYALIGDGRYHSIFGATRVDGTPCSKDCPSNVDIPSYLSKIRDGNLAEAARILLDSNPLPAITGRVCPHFCENDCNRGNFDEPVSIRCIERFIGDYVLENSDTIYEPPQNDTNKRVAIIGSGPAGLSAAYYLRRFGHRATVFERMKEPGGLLTYGIPPYRLPKDIVKKQIVALKGMGIELVTNTTIGKGNEFDEFMNKYDAVFMACGAWKEKASGIKGEELMTSGAEFLRNSNVSVGRTLNGRVGIIGGGNVAVDVARSVLRLGAEPVIIYRRSRAEMPALKEEITKAEQEGIKMEVLTLPVEASKKGNKIVIKCTRMELGPLDETGRPRPVPIKGSEFTTEFDSVMKAIGEEPDTSIIPHEFFSEKGQLTINASSYALGKNVFAGGDFVSGPSTVIAAIAAGKKAASSINKFLNGTEGQGGEKHQIPTKSAERFNSAYLKKTNRVNVPELSVAERIKDINVEESGTLNINDIKLESNRCFNCGCVAVNSSDVAPALIALDAKIKTSKRVIEAENFFTVQGDKTTILDDEEIVTEIRIPVPRADTKSKFIKFALRKSVDFPIVNCAAVIESKKGIVKSARICLNSVYNQPYRVTKAEEYLRGKSISESTAETAADAAVSDAFPLINNKYKIQIARTLVKRAIIACQADS